MDTNWNPDGWASGDVVSWDAIGAWVQQVVSAVSGEMWQSGLYWYILGMVLVLVVIAVGRFIYERL